MARIVVNVGTGGSLVAIRGDVVIAHPADLIIPGILGAVVLFWVAGFDIIYACQDFDYDKQAKLKSIPVRFGVSGALRIATMSHLLMLSLLFFLPFSSLLGAPSIGLGLVYWIGIIGLTLLLIYEHFLVKPDDLTKVNIAFFQVNAIVSIGLFVVVSIDLFV